MITEHELECESYLTNICVVTAILYNITLYCTHALCNNWLGSDQSILFRVFLYISIALHFNKKISIHMTASVV
jgi:hypothetical protein